MKTQNTGIKIGSEAENIKALEKAILSILSTNKDNETIRVALNVLGKGAIIENALVTNCSVVMK